MPETPDFEQIAHRIAMSLPGAIGPPFVLLREHIWKELRLAWNARGAADLVALEASLASQVGATEAGRIGKNLNRALRALDR